jgi:hypothetical protein
LLWVIWIKPLIPFQTYLAFMPGIEEKSNTWEWKMPLFRLGIWMAIELVQPLDDPESPDDAQRTLNRKGEGIMNLCLTVEDLRKAIVHLEGTGVRIIKGKDADGEEIAFVHPKDVNGVLVELRTGKRHIKET